MSHAPLDRDLEHAHDPPPARVGRYEVLAPLGHGGMASVYLVRGLGSAGFERLAAMKILHRGLCADQEFVEMFLDEARLAAHLHHPNTAAILDLGSTGLQPFMVMDYVEGDTLDAVQRAASSVRRAVPLGIALRVALDALAGLDAAHRLMAPDGAPLGLIHRDVSPHNVLVGVDGVARLVDFGIARAASRRTVTAVGVVKGNLPFMSPEQLRGHGVDPRSDVFSMGVTLWETLSLRRCFPTREGAAMSRLAREDYRPLAEFAPSTPASLDVICRRALAFDPADRYATAADFAAAIEDAFRHDVATQRELARFMSVVAATKVRRERDAVRASALPAPGRLAPPPPESGRRGRFAPVRMESFFDPEVPTAVAPWRRQARRAGRALRSWAMPSAAPPRVATWRFGAPPPQPPADLRGTLYEAVTEALFRRRQEVALAPVGPSEWVTRRIAPVAVPDAFGASVTRRLARLSQRPPPGLLRTGLDAPTTPRAALRPLRLASLKPPPPRLGPFAPLRELIARLWLRLGM
jgi:serine/threonine protein kinase